MKTKAPIQQPVKTQTTARTPQPASESAPVRVSPQAHSATLVQRARRDPRSLAPQDVRQLQRAIGNRSVLQLLDTRMIGHSLTKTMTNGANEHRVTDVDNGIVQRTLQGVAEQLVNSGGKVSTTAKVAKYASLGIVKSTYDKILSAIKEYAKKEANPKTEGTWFLGKLTEIEQLCTKWFDDAENKQAIREHKPEYVNRAQALMDLLRQIDEERTNRAQSATLNDMKLHVDDVTNGHLMAITLTIECPLNPIPSHIPHTVYGVRLEYWEKIEILYDFKDDGTQQDTKIQQEIGKQTKQWNDIYALAPKVATWELSPSDNSISWKDAVEKASEDEDTKKASEGTLTGTVHVGFVDSPVFSAPPKRYGKRILRFRIVASDQSNNRREILATQTIGVANASVTKHFDVGANAPATATVEQNVNPSGQNPTYDCGIPNAADLALPTFVQNLRNGQAEDFDNVELNEVKTICNQHNQSNEVEYKYSKIGRVGPDDVPLAGVNLTPYPQAGQRHKQHIVDGGPGLLVALMQGARILRMYYTDGTVRSVKHGEVWNEPIDVRSFEEIPIETVNQIPAQPGALP